MNQLMTYIIEIMHLMSSKLKSLEDIKGLKLIWTYSRHSLKQERVYSAGLH